MLKEWSNSLARSRGPAKLWMNERYKGVQWHEWPHESAPRGALSSQTRPIPMTRCQHWQTWARSCARSRAAYLRDGSVMKTIGEVAQTANRNGAGGAGEGL